MGRSDDSAADSASNPATPADMSPYMNAEMYSLPHMDAIALPQRAETPHMALYAALPDIMDPKTATNVPIRHICCIGAGYVG